MPLDLTPILDLTPLDEEESTPPERESVAPSFTEPPPVPEVVIPESGGGLPPRLSDSEWDALRNKIALREEGAGLRGEAEGLATLERAATVAETPLIPASITESALALTTPALATVPGVRKSIAEAASGLTSPVNIGLAVAGGGASAIPRIGGAVARGIAGGFAADIATHMPELGSVAGEASVTGTPEEQQKALADIGVSALMGGLAGGGAAARARPVIPPRVVEAIAKADQVGLTKSAQALADKTKRDAVIDIAAKVEPEITKPTEVTDAIREPSATKGVLRQERPEVELQGVREPQVEAAIPREPTRPQGGEEGQVLLTGPEVIRSIETLPDVEAGALRQKPAVEAGMKLTEADVPALEAARDKAMADATAFAEAGNNDAFKAAFGKNIWFSGAIEGARRKGPNYDTFIEQQKAATRQPVAGEIQQQVSTTPLNQPGDGAKVPGGVRAAEPTLDTAPQTSPPTATTPPEAVPAGPVGGGAAGRPAVAGAEMPAQVVAPENISRQHRGRTGSWVIRNIETGEVVLETTQRSVVEKLNTKKYEAVPIGDYLESLSKTETTPAQLPQTEIRGAGAPPVEPPPTPPAAPGAPAPPPPGTPRATLDDVYKIFEPAPKKGPTIGERASGALESFRTGFSSKFRPLNKLAEDVASTVGGTAKDVAGIFEQLKGSSGKAEADVYRFDKDVSDAVKGSEKDFNAYVFLRRSLDRLQQDAADIARAQAGENVPNLNRRKVSQYTIPELEAKLTTLSEQIGGEKLAEFNRAADAYQTHMDQALRLQVESGRMSPEVYDAIKEGNQFYAPFKVMKYIEETMRPEGSGRRVDTAADYVKAMEGIEDPNFKLGDMLAAARQNLTLSRTLAEKNRAMQNITELAALDVDGNFVRKLKPGEDSPGGMEAVNVLENGQKQRYSVNKDVAEAIGALGPRSANLLMRLAASTFRAGATTFNLPFQISNILADTPRAALVSKYGINIIPELVLYPFDVAYAKAKGIPVEQINQRLARSAVQSLRFPLSLLEGIYSSFTGEVGGVNNKLMLDFLESGAAGTTFQEFLTPGSLRQPKSSTGSKALDAGRSVLKTPGAIAQAVEQINKVGGVKQAMKAHGVESGKALPSEAITELRRFSGSPDFGRVGKWVENYGLNLAQMFLNARIQGAVADVGRLTGRDGARQAASTWINLGAWVGLPSLYLYVLNNRDEEARENYAARPKQEKQNYWLVPKTDDDGKQRYIKGANGESVPDYWRIPKRESAKWTGNFVEAGLEFAKAQDPETFRNWSVGLLEDISPLNVQGESLTERVESVASGLNPLLKAPLETATGRDTYRHRNIVPDSQKKASPEEQYTDRTAEVFKSLATAMPDVAPEVFRSPLMLENVTKNFTAGLLTQFLPRQPVEGRSAAENLPLAQRFQALPYTDSSEFDQRIQKFERESADEQLKRLRDAKAIMEGNKGAKPDVLIKQMVEKHGRDPKLAERIVDLYVAEQRGITTQERRILALPITQRAEYLADELKGKTPEQKQALLRNYALKRILTERVAAELAPRLAP